ncbi:TrlF family AAA-like ATPase [Planococcus kocurii]|uniref:TrlF family AAA-like ATPase n=1 Tax=Planococcus kocurii TaxID=1374 RepID=UPI003D02CC49
MELTRGSLWRKWDLHIHTPSSYDYELKEGEGYSDELLVEQWVKKKFAAVAITDHFTIDMERIGNLKLLASKKGITVFPGIEFRTDKGADNIHIIAIFSENIDVHTLSSYFKYNTLENACNPQSNETIYWKMDDIQSLVSKFDGLLTVHAGNKSSGIDKQMDNDKFFSAIKKEYANIVDAFEVNNLRSYESYKKNVIPYIMKSINKEKPVIVSSDNHNCSQYELSTNLWIKADPTFEGLKQAFLHSEERVFVGDKPEKIIHLETNPKRIMKELKILKVDKPSNEETWFKSELPLNPSLTAIIGNKGSGKSAISDVLGLVNYSSRLENLAFLKSDRFNKVPQQYGKDYKAEIEWFDGETQELENLYVDSNTTFSTPSTAQYLPQTYIEKICGDIGNKVFQDEINKVIFSYIPIETRLGASNFEEFILTKTTPLRNELKTLSNKINEINIKIIDLELKQSEKFLISLRQNLAALNSDLERQKKNKPVEILKPDDEASQEVTKDISKISHEIEKLDEDILAKKETLTRYTTEIQELFNIQSEYKNIASEINAVNSRISKKLESLKIPLNGIEISYTLPTGIIEERIHKAKENEEELTLLLHSPNGLFNQKNQLQKEKEELIKKSTQRSQEYFSYLRNLATWEETLKKITGDESTEGTLAYYKKLQEYIDNNISNDYSELLERRKSIIKEVYQTKSSIKELYEEIYRPIDSELSNTLGDIKEDVEFNTRFIFDNDIILGSLDNINKKPKSIFQGIQDSKVSMLELIEQTDINNFDDAYQLIYEVLSCGLKDDFDQINKVIINKLDFYNQIASLDYLEVDYQLSYDGNNLTELSPGERGLVLLVFYLALSKDEMPIIIDQPEDNLDNQSVYSRLVPCIKKAKKRRQVIIVTHNPNIAVACDAEQIIVAEINKSEHSISYISGSIENENINNKIVEILEGTRPAFKLRESKYLSIT